MRIGVDLMGSDTAPQHLFEGILEAQKLLEPKDSLILFVTAEIKEILSANSSFSQYNHAQIHWKIAEDYISFLDEPLLSLKQKKKTSLLLGIKELKKRAIDAFITAGNTGALIAAATLYLPKLPGIKRAALLALLPTKEAPVALIDVGGNLSSTSDHLVQFAKLGAAFQACHLALPKPTVGLLNIGIESKKGTTELKLTYELLDRIQEESHFTFVGNIEGRSVFDGNLDVLVTNAVLGNVLLKTAEGVSSLIFERLKASQSCFEEERSDSFKKAMREFSYSEYPGAIVMGVDGILMKCHGAASAQSIYQSVKMAKELYEKDFLIGVKKRLSGQINRL